MNLKLKKVLLKWSLSKIHGNWDPNSVMPQLIIPNIFTHKPKEIKKEKLFKATYSLSLTTKHGKRKWKYMDFMVKGTEKEIESVHKKVMDICRSKSNALLYMRDKDVKELAKVKVADFSDVEIEIQQTKPPSLESVTVNKFGGWTKTNSLKNIMPLRINDYLDREFFSNTINKIITQNDKNNDKKTN